MAMIAKKPEERPGSTAAVARAATALRRGDLAAAAAAVPAIASGAVVADDVTQLLTPAGATAATTRLMPTDSAALPVEPEKKKRSPWTWPLIALIVILALVIGGTVWALVSNQQPAPDPSTTTASTPPVSPSASTPVPSATRINLDGLGLVGTNCTEAVNAANQAGLRATQVAGQAAPSAEQVGTVESTDPSAGNLDPGTDITITCFAEQTAIPAPAAGPTVEPAPVPGGSAATVSWAAYSCPSGTGNVSGYTVTITGATFAADGTQQRNFAPGEVSADINAAPSGTITARYAALCSGGSSGDQRASGDSPTTQVQISAAPTTPPPTEEPEE